jgi:hypothetical protein
METADILTTQESTHVQITNKVPAIGPPWQCCSSQGALCQAVSGQKKIDYWNGTSGAVPPLPNTPSWHGAQLKHRGNFTFTLTVTLFLWFCSEWLLAVSKNNVCLKGTKISGYWRHPNNVTTALKAVPRQEFQKCFQQWQVASLG